MTDSSKQIDGASDSDSTTLGSGLVIAICAAALLFGGEALVWWTVDAGVETTKPLPNNRHLDLGFAIEYGMDEGSLDMEMRVWEADDSSKEDLTGGVMNEKNSTKWTDSDCDCDETKDFFTNLKYMVYGLLASGLAIAYFGQTNKMEYLSIVAIIGALISAGIMAYTFVTLPEASLDGEDVEDTFWAPFDKDPALIANLEKEGWDEDFETEVKFNLKTMPGVAYFVPVVTLTLFVYLLYYNSTRVEVLPERKSYAGVDQWSKTSDSGGNAIKELDLDNLLSDGKETFTSDDKGDMPSVTANPVKGDEKTSEEDVQSFQAKKEDSGEMATIKCPTCASKMEVRKLGKMQNVTCNACGTSGDIDI